MLVMCAGPFLRGLGRFLYRMPECGTGRLGVQRIHSVSVATASGAGPYVFLPHAEAPFVLGSRTYLANSGEHMATLRVLVTGSAGALGYRIALGLSNRGHIVRGFDLRPQRLPGDHRIGSLLDVRALEDAAKGVDAIVHAAAVPERQNFADELVPNNIVGTHNVFEVARLRGVKRVINTSSIRVTGGLDWESGCIGLDLGYVPCDHYGVSKITGEVIGEMYSRRFAIAVVSVRIGWFVRNQQEANLLPTLKAGPRIYLSHRDAQDFYVHALEQPDIAHCAIYVTSRNGDDSAFDLEPARRIFGFVPQDSFPEGSQWSSSEDFPSPLTAPSLRPNTDPSKA